MDNNSQNNQKLANLAIGLSLLSVVVAVASVGTLFYLYGEIQRIEPQPIGNDDVTTQTEPTTPTTPTTLPVVNAGPSFEELNVDPPPPVTDQAAYREWVELYGEASLEYQKSIVETDDVTLEVSTVGIAMTLQEENWLDSELLLRQSDFAGLTREEEYLLREEMLQEYRAGN